MSDMRFAGLGQMTAEEAAEEVRQVYWGDAYPVDPRAIASAMGIDVFYRDLPENVSGVLLKRPGQDPAIYLSTSDSTPRRHFTCAHEIGHYVIRLAKGTTAEYAYRDLRGELASQGTDPEEIFANRFAAALLMPRAEVDRMKGEGIVRMLKHFGVSDDALTLRLRNLGLVGGG